MTDVSELDRPETCSSPIAPVQRCEVSDPLGAHFTALRGCAEHPAVREKQEGMTLMSGNTFDTDDDRGCADAENHRHEGVHAERKGIGCDTVTCRTLVRLVQDQKYPQATTDLRYDSAEPFSVGLEFNVGTDRSVEWTFGRELLVSGLQRLSGFGDVQIWPSRIRGAELVFISLHSGDSTDLVAAPAIVIKAFLERTLAVVPLGEETRYLDIQSATAQLLNET
ncbi:SsgA family sporulation/cell division regulator [Streptomyces sp. V4I2]|uniref:SsgA family sporulation/cell division regulator n=1 Tax=Streptomyces sp. V4I2 TaxID=3042280 RepID=UPI002781BBD4|nr:SsgA family sporulation/cell division regulator [Streptomyces sp. V4I2]MDQ1051362.1 hypothetical protein [Streptomyces sp. V4I2]